MNQDIRYYRRRSPRITIVLGLVLFVGSQAHADVLGRLHFIVKNADTEKPIAGATISVTDPANVVAPFTLTTDAKGEATTAALPARAWSVKTKADTFDEDDRSSTVVADNTTDVEVLMEPLKEKVIKVSGSKNVTRPGDVSQATVRAPSDLKSIPVSPANAQSFAKFIQTVPGAALDSVGQLHIDGEHSSDGLVLNGFQLPAAFQGRFGQILSPASIQSVDVLTGGYAPEYGRETAAILNVNLRAGTIDPFVNYSETYGSYSTFESGFTIGGQIGQEYGLPNDQGKKARRFAYLVSADGRTTANALESPQPDDQTAHNNGISYVSFGNFDYHASEKDTFNLTVSSNPARAEVANRTGLSSFYIPFGQGYGFGGLQAASSGLPTQEQDGQDIYQSDHNEFGVISYLRDINSKTQARLSFGLIHNGLDVLNNNPAVNLADLPADNSIEYNPTLIRNSRDAEGDGSITSTAGPHNMKFGFTIDRQTGLESYSLIPASQAALNNLLSGDPTDSTPDPTNVLYPLRPNGTSAATVTVGRSGYYNAAYAQDTWKFTKAFTANYGLRMETFTSDQVTQRDTESPLLQHIGLQMLEPRVNLSYALPGRTVVRASYNKLMIVPPSAQGAGIDIAVQPEKIDQYEGSIERQTGPGQSVKIREYQKDIRDQLDTGLLVPGTQIGVFVTDTIPRDLVRGTEISYNMFPSQPYGFNGYVSWANAVAHIDQGTQTEDGVYNDHDQLNTISTGFNYTCKHGETAGMVIDYGSGFASSQINNPDGTLYQNGRREPHTQVNLRFASAPLLKGKATVELDVQNLFDERNYLNFDSGFSGTRFEQGRFILLSVSGKL